MDTYEHRLLSSNSTSSELTFHTAGGPTVAADAISPRHVLGALDNLSADGWEVVGPPTVVQGDSVMATSYLLRRRKGPKSDFQMPQRIR